MGGTFDEVSGTIVSGLVRSLLQERFGLGVSGTCTLLGPEGPGADRVFGSGWWLFLEGLFWCHGCGMREVYRPYFENYTVDASIFHATLRGCVV